jgi:hypothetical protein
MNRELAARKAFYQVISNALVIPGGSGDKIPVFDNKADAGNRLYVLIEGQTARSNSDFRVRRWSGTVRLTILHIQDDSYTRDIVDSVTEQIEAIITPGKANENGLPDMSSFGWQITNVVLDDVSYADFQISETETICEKYLTFNLIITKI